jgi:hypothetical protein
MGSGRKIGKVFGSIIQLCLGPDVSWDLQAIMALNLPLEDFFPMETLITTRVEFKLQMA